MTPDQIAGILWRRRILFIGTLVACLAAVTALTFSLPKTYKATATLYAGVNKEANEALAVDTALGEQLARTYASLVANPNVADAVRLALSDRGMSRSELLDRMSFAPVERTQLLEVSAEGSSPTQAQRLANTYAAVFVRRVAGQFARGETQARVSLSESAALPKEASKPDPPLYLGLGALLSLGVALGAVLLRERMDDRIRAPEDTDEVLGQPIVARIPVVAKDRADRQLGADDAFRLLKTNIDFYEETPAQAVMVTSPSPVEGKSMISAYLGSTAASDGERVVLIESDLRRPGLSGTLAGQGLDPSPVGLSNYLVGVADEQAILTSHPRVPGLDVIWSGPLPPNPSALLRSRRFGDLIESLREDYDRLIIDTPPISVGADASVVSSHVDGTLFVVDVPKTKRSFAQAGLNQLEKAHAHLYGVVLNREQGFDLGGYSYYGADSVPNPALNGKRQRRAGV